MRAPSTTGHPLSVSELGHVSRRRPFTSPRLRGFVIAGFLAAVGWAMAQAGLTVQAWVVRGQAPSFIEANLLGLGRALERSTDAFERRRAPLPLDTQAEVATASIEAEELLARLTIAGAGLDRGAASDLGAPLSRVTANLDLLVRQIDSGFSSNVLSATREVRRSIEQARATADPTLDAVASELGRATAKNPEATGLRTDNREANALFTIGGGVFAALCLLLALIVLLGRIEHPLGWFPFIAAPAGLLIANLSGPLSAPWARHVELASVAGACGEAEDLGPKLDLTLARIGQIRDGGGRTLSANELERSVRGAARLGFIDSEQFVPARALAALRIRRVSAWRTNLEPETLGPVELAMRYRDAALNCLTLAPENIQNTPLNRRRLELALRYLGPAVGCSSDAECGKGERCDQTRETCRRNPNSEPAESKPAIDADRIGKSCDAGGVGACRKGQTAVSGQQLICEPSTPREELCDQEDNDCDGMVDEGAGCAMTKVAEADLGCSLGDSRTITFFGRCPAGQVRFQPCAVLGPQAEDAHAEFVGWESEDPRDCRCQIHCGRSGLTSRTWNIQLWVVSEASP